MARRRRAKENPGAGFWIAVGVGVVAVGGVAYVMTRPSTASAATPAPALPTHPTNDAATYSPAAAAAAASAASSAASQAAGGSPVTLSYTVNGRSLSTSYTPNPGALATDMSNAILAAQAGRGPGAEGEVWKARALVDGASQAQITQLQSYGYSV